MILSRRRRRSAGSAETDPEDLNMTPMIDIVFQLLIFFMLTLQFKEVEGKLMSVLPKDKGPVPGPALVIDEVRIIICAGGDSEVHRTNKGRHMKVDKDGTECMILVERHEMGRVHRTAEASGAAATNLETYRTTGIRARDILEVLKKTAQPGKKPVLILDADSEVPYEHVIGVVNGLKEAGINNIEFAANPKFMKYAR